MTSLGPNELRTQYMNDQYDTSVNMLRVITHIIAAELRYISMLSRWISHVAHSWTIRGP